jgi:hypothetical protein
MRKVIVQFTETSSESKITLPLGYFLTTRSFEISPGGGWALGFGKGWLLQYTKDKELLVFNPATSGLVRRFPPVGSTKKLDISKYGDSQDQKDILEVFTKSTKKLSTIEFKHLCEEKLDNYGR